MLRALFGELVDLLRQDHPPAGASAPDALAALIGMPDAGRPIEAPTDPALARLLPDAYRDDPDAAREFRRFTEGALRAGKLSAAVAMRDALGAGRRLVLAEEDAQVWLGALNDLRLATGARLEITEETYDEVDELGAHDPRRAELSIFAWLGYLEETLVAALAGW